MIDWKKRAEKWALESSPIRDTDAIKRRAYLAGVKAMGDEAAVICERPPYQDAQCAAAIRSLMPKD